MVRYNVPFVNGPKAFPPIPMPHPKNAKLAMQMEFAMFHIVADGTKR